MAFTVETGTGVAGANSYITVQEFKDYHGDRGTDLGDFAGTGDIQDHLVKASDFVDRRWVFKAVPLTTTQRLECPRDGMYDRYGNELTGIPTKLKEAVAEYALFLKANPLFLETVAGTTGLQVTLQREKVGPLETETRYGAGYSGESTPSKIQAVPTADALMRDLVVSAREAIR